MIRVNDILTGLRHLVGWQQNFNPDDYRISDDLTVSDSGVYFQQVHPLLTLDNLRNVAPDFGNMEFQEYDEEAGYSMGDIVQAGGKLYKLVTESNKSDSGYISPEDPEQTIWFEYDPFSDWLRKKTDACVVKVVSQFCSSKLADVTARNICENKALFSGAGRIADTVENNGRLVGLELVPIRSKGVTLKINKIGLQFTIPGVYRLYLMNSGCDTIVQEIELTKTKANTMEWFKVDDLLLPYMPEFGDTGGSWYLVYKQQELPVNSKAVSKNRDWSKAPCRSCSVSDFNSWLAWSRYLEIHPFYVNPGNWGGPLGVDYNSDYNGDYNDDYYKEKLHLWNVENNVYDYSTNFGLNLEVTVACDLTDFIVEQKSIFTDVIAKQMAVDMLREFVYNANVRTNRHSINASKADIVYALDGDTAAINQAGLAHQLELAYKALTLSTMGIDRVCMPCKNNGVKYRTV